MKKSISCLAVFAALLFALNVNAQTPVITSFTPLSGAVGTTVTITGTNFNATTTNNIVFFGATRATVTAAGATELTVTVPSGATHAAITVLNTGTSLAAYSGAFFLPTFTPNKGGITANDIAAKVDFATGTDPYSVAIGDIDGDGLPDLAVANNGNNTVSVLRNTGSSGSVSFVGKVDFATGSVPYSVAIGDINGDGKPDLAVANAVSNTVSILRNTGSSGSISFAGKADFATGSFPIFVAIGDIDGDGRPDLAVANNDDATVSVLRNTGSSGSISFAGKADFVTGSGTRFVAIGDIDGDGKPDLVVANRVSNTVSVLRNTGSSGTIGFAAKADFTTGIAPIFVVIGDLDGDGKPDLAVANSSNNTVSVLRNTGSSGSISFAGKADFTTGTSPVSVAIGDIDGDGKSDLAVANAGSNTVSVLRNTGNSGSISFAGKADFATGTLPYSVAIGDLDGDGKSDLAVTSGSNTVSVLRNNPVFPPPAITSFTPLSGAFGTTVTITGANFNTTAGNNIVFFGATRATVTAAGATELTVTVPAGATHAAITVLNTATGLAAYSRVFFLPTFTPNKGGITANDIAAKVDFGTGTNPRFVAIGDIDGDGLPDLAVANESGSIVSVLRNTGSSGSVSFAAKVDLTTGSVPYSIAIGDIDGDGLPDLAVANNSSNTVSVLRNTGSSGSISFAAKVDLTTGSIPRSVAIGDIDGDGRPDLAVANGSSNTVSVLRNTGSPGSVSFAAKVDFATGTEPISVAIGDIDGDGKPDLAASNNAGNTVSVLRNTGSPGSVSFAGKVDFGTGTTPRSVVIGDIDGDGLPDLTVANFGSNSVSVLRNTGSPGSITAGSFAASENFGTGISPLSVAIGDIDGDGRPDLAVANVSGNTVSVLRNTGSSGIVSFAGKVDFGTGTSPQSVAIGDMDGDGKPDLAVANRSSNTVSVLRNTPVFPPPTITSFTPLSGEVGATVTITGTNFNTTAGNNIVFFGATRATVTAASAAELTVTVPAGATHAAITVLNTATALAAYSQAFFLPTFTPNKGGITASDFAAKVDFTTGSDPFFVAIGDIDGDGLPDLAVANVSSNTVSVLRNTGSSGTISFAAKADFATGTTPYSVAIGDIDGDGMPDLTVANQNSLTVSVLRNTGSPGSISFAAKVDFATGISSRAVAIGDLDGDGKPDLAVANYFDNTVSVLRNTGSPGSISFAGKVDLTTGSGPQSIAIGDLDGDGLPDLAVANENSNTVSVLRNTGSPGSISFAGKVDFATGSRPYSVAIGDLDGDGKPDLAVTNVGDDNVSVLLNTGSIGSIGFAGKADFTTGTTPVFIAIGDINGDGKPDLATANQNSHIVSVLRNAGSSGSISFAAKEDLITENPRAIAIGDIDGDGRPDLAVADRNNNTVSVLRNTPVIISVAGTLSAVSATYGTASATPASFTVSGENMAEGITVTPPPGFEVSTDETTGYAGGGTAITVGAAGTIVSTTVYVRLAATTAVGAYSGNVACTSPGANTVNVATASSTVSAAPLTVTASNAGRTYGSTLTGGTGSTAFTSSGLQNSETIGTVTIAYAAGAGNGNAATDPAGTYTGKVTPGAATGGTFTASNYSITYTAGDIIVGAAPLTVTASDQSKSFGTALDLGTSSFIASGLQNGETIGSVTLTSTGADGSAAVGTYPIVPSMATGGTFTASNYTISYTDGTLTVLALTNADLSGLSLNSGTLAPLFASGTTAYTASVSNTTGSVTVTPTLTSPAATVTVNGAAVNSGSQSGNIPLNTGNNTITTVVTAQDGVTTKTYTVIVTRLKADQTVIFADLPQKIYGTADFDPGATASSGLTISYSSGNTAVATIVSGKIHLVGVGTSVITASQAGDAGYNAAASVDQTLTVISGAPDNISLAQNTLYENQPPGVQAGTLSSTSPDPNAAFTYSLVSGTGSADNALFSISDDKLLTAAVLDYEQKSSYSILVRSTTQHGFSLDKQFTVSISDVNEAPTLTVINNQVLCYTTAAQTIALSGITAGQETGQGTTLSVSSGNAGLLGQLSITGSGTTGTISYVPADPNGGTTTITVTVTDDGGTANGGADTFSRTFTITVNPVPAVTVSSSLGTDISKGLTAQLTASGGTSYNWAAAGGIINGQNTAVLTVRPTITTTYTVTVTNASGCNAVQSITLNVLEDYKTLNANNILTPNGDGKNDTWVIQNIDMYPNNVVKIFDRAGRLVFSKQGYTNDWQGTVEGQPLSEDSYFYIVDFGEGTGEKRGFISIIR